MAQISTSRRKGEEHLIFCRDQLVDQLFQEGLPRNDASLGGPISTSIELLRKLHIHGQVFQRSRAHPASLTTK